jgi:hypothetical protein
MDSYLDYWIYRDWIVNKSTTADPSAPDILRFTPAMTIEGWRYSTTVLTHPPTKDSMGNWATGCTWDSTSDSLRGSTPDGSKTFVITRNGITVYCTFTDVAARRRLIQASLLGVLSGGFAGFLTGVALRVAPMTALAIGGIAASVSTLMAIYSTYSTQTADVWVANEGGSGIEVEDPGNSNEKTSDQSGAPALRAV